MFKRRIRSMRIAGAISAMCSILALTGCGGAAPAQPPKSATKSLAPVTTKPAAKASVASKPAATVASKPAANAPALKKVTVVLDWLVSGEHGPFYLAKQDGFFRKQGLDVTIVPGKGSGLAIAQVANGDYTFAQASGTVLMQYVAKGSPVRMVFDMAREGSDAVIYPANLPIRTPTGLEGRSIAFTPGGAAPTILPTFLKLAHVDMSKVKLVATRANQRDSLLLSHKVDAVDSSFTTEHGILLGHGMQTKWFTYASVGLNLPNYGIVVNTNLIAHHPNTIREFLRALVQGMKAAEQHPLAAVQATKALSHAADFKVAPNLIVLKDNITTWTTPSSQGKPLGWMPPKDWASAAKILERYMHVKPFDVQSAYTNRFIPNH